MSDAAPVYGAAPEVRLIPYRVSDSVVHFDFTNLTQALYRARDQKCDLVSMSLGGPWAGRSLSRAVDTLVAADIILLAAAGNVAVGRLSSEVRQRRRRGSEQRHRQAVEGLGVGR
jgi:subtilisin family serine protease